MHPFQRWKSKLVQLRRLKRWPTTIIFSASGTLLASVVEQLHPDVFPHRVRAVEAYSVYRLNLDDAVASSAAHPQHMARNL
jgi:hypothetical protein